MTDTIADYEFPKINPDGPIPAPNRTPQDACPSAQAGRELSAYGDKDYPESCLQSRAAISATRNAPAGASRTGSAAYGNMREVEANPSDGAQFEGFDAQI